MKKLVILLSLMIAWAAGLAGDAGAEPVLCIAQNAADGKLEGAIQTRIDVCGAGEIELGRVVDPAQGRIDFHGQVVQLPEGSFDPDALPPAEASNE